LSPYGLQLREKQKVMHGYGWRDKQLKNEYVKAKSGDGDVGINFLMSSELRLDNVVFQSGIVNTLRFARQLVSYGHFLVDGKKVNIPSYKIEAGQVISLRKEKMKENKLIKGSLEQNAKTPPYINLDKQKFTISYLRHPLPEELNKTIDTSLVVE
jgi:small subunit ribosomal protein S4